MFLFCESKEKNRIDLFLIEDPKLKPIIYPVAEGSKLYSRVYDANDESLPTLAKVSNEMRVCAFTDLESIYVHSLETDKLIVKVTGVGYPILFTCLPSSDGTSLDITYMTDMDEDEKVDNGNGKEVFIRETVSLENWNQCEDLIEVISLIENEPIDTSKIIYKSD